jgi:GNAT superfamily N-acetyltransferase
MTDSQQHAFIDRIGANGAPISLADADAEAALREGEALHRDFRPDMKGDYIAYMQRMAAEGASLTQLFDDGEVRAIAVWRRFLTTYCGRRFEIDDLVTAESQRSKGYGAAMMRALEAKARSLSCNAILLSSATHRTGAHRFYLRERFAIVSFLFAKPVR